MRTAIFVSLLLACALFAACERQANTPAPPKSTNTAAGSPLNAPADYLNALTKGQQSAIKTVDVTSINKALELFNVEQGRYPKDLTELVQKKYLPQIPQAPAGMKLVYDPNAGTVRVQP